MAPGLRVYTPEDHPAGSVTECLPRDATPVVECTLWWLSGRLSPGGLEKLYNHCICLFKGSFVMHNCPIIK